MNGTVSAAGSGKPYHRDMQPLTEDEIGRLSPAERLDLIGQLWDSLEEDQVPLTDAQRTQLNRRLASLDTDRSEGVTWAELKAELERRCP